MLCHGCTTFGQDILAKRLRDLLEEKEDMHRGIRHAIKATASVQSRTMEILATVARTEVTTYYYSVGQLLP